MARRGERAAISDMRDAEFVDATAEDVTEQEEAAKTDEQTIAAEMGEVDGDARIWFVVHKIVPESRDRVWCMEGTAADQPVIPKLQARFGGGKYHITIMKDSKYKKRITVTIADVITQTPQHTPQTQTAFPANDPRILALLERAVQTPAQKPMDAIAIITAISAAAPAIQLIRDMLIPKTDTLGMFKAVAEIMTTLQPQGGSDREPSIVEVIGNVLTKTDLINNLGAIVAPQAQPTQPQRPQLPPGTHQAPQTPTPEQIQQAQVAQLKQQLEILVGRAQKGSDPDLYAELIVDNYGPDVVRQLAAPGAIEFCIALVPQVATFRPWFELLLTSLTELVQGEDEQGAEGEPALTNPHVGGSPVSAPNTAHETNVDPFGNAGDARDAAPYGEAG